MNAKQAIAEVKRLLKSHGFEDAGIVSAEEHEDGVGAGVGSNWIKNGVWYTEPEALTEIGMGIVLLNKRGDKKAIFKSSRAVTSSARFHEAEGHAFSFEIISLSEIIPISDSIKKLLDSPIQF